MGVRRTFYFAIFYASIQSAAAFDPADLERFRTTGDCPGCDLSDAFMIGLWSEEMPEGAGNLRAANLRSATISGIGAGFDFRDADLSGATATYMDFGAADFTGAILDDLRTYLTEFTGSIFWNARIRNVTFTYSVDGADFTGANLTGSDLTSSTITQEQLDTACGSGVALPDGLSIAPCPGGAD